MVEFTVQQEDTGSNLGGTEARPQQTSQVENVWEGFAQALGSALSKTKGGTEIQGADLEPQERSALQQFIDPGLPGFEAPTTTPEQLQESVDRWTLRGTTVEGAPPAAGTAPVSPVERQPLAPVQPSATPEVEAQRKSIRQEINDFLSERFPEGEQRQASDIRKELDMFLAQKMEDRQLPTPSPRPSRPTYRSVLRTNPRKIPGVTNVPGAVQKTNNPILELIAYAEGTTPERNPNAEGYNTTLGYGAYTGGSVNLTGMTLKEVDQLQTRMLKHPDNRWNSSAVGRYQIVRTTLRSLKKKLKLPDDAVFDEKLQDRLALELLNQRGLKAFKSGQISEARLINNLSKEWASFPTTSGVGYYSNQKDTPITPDRVRSALRF